MNIRKTDKFGIRPLVISKFNIFNYEDKNTFFYSLPDAYELWLCTGS